MDNIPGPHCPNPSLLLETPGHHWRTVQTFIWGPPKLHLVANTGDLFKRVHLRKPPPPEQQLVVVTETRMLYKRAVRILLEWFPCSLQKLQRENSKLVLSL